MNEYQSSDGYVKARGITASQKPLYRADVFDIIEATTTCALKSEIHKRQLKFYNNCIGTKDLPMQRFIIRKALDSNCNFIKHYVNLNKIYKNSEDITKETLSALKDNVQQKANANHPRYQAYLLMNSSLTRPSIYSRDVPSNKLIFVSQIRMVSHSLQIELGRQQKNVPRTERLCTCGNVEDEKHFISDCHLYSHIREQYAELQYLPLHKKLDNVLTPDYIHDFGNHRKLK